jgi:hypothetical protein
MYHFREFAKKLNLVDQLPGYDIVVRCDRILIDGADYRLDVYGWPDNRVVFANKVTGQNTIKRFGHNGRDKCRKFYLDCLESIGVDLTAVE